MRSVKEAIRLDNKQTKDNNNNNNHNNQNKSGRPDEVEMSWDFCVFVWNIVCKQIGIFDQIRWQAVEGRQNETHSRFWRPPV